MPLYEYQCDACERQFELIRKFSDPPLEECPHCGGKIRKLFSSPAIQFKGSGFYITDYAKKDQTSASPSGDSKSDAASKDKERGEVSAKTDTTEKSDKTEKSEKTEKNDRTERNGKSEKTNKDDKGTAKTDSTSPTNAPGKKTT